MTDESHSYLKSGYSVVNGLKMYYEIHLLDSLEDEQEEPLVLIHCGGSTINTSFGRILPMLRKSGNVPMNTFVLGVDSFYLRRMEIKPIWLKYNRALKKYEPKLGLFTYEDLQDYKRLFIGKYNKRNLPVQIFTTRESGMNKLR